MRIVELYNTYIHRIYTIYIYVHYTHYCSTTRFFDLSSSRSILMDLFLRGQKQPRQQQAGIAAAAMKVRFPRVKVSFLTWKIFSSVKFYEYLCQKELISVQCFLVLLSLISLCECVFSTQYSTGNSYVSCLIKYIYYLYYCYNKFNIFV